MRTTLYSSELPVVSIEHQLERIALEGQFTQNLAQLFHDILPAFRTRLSQLQTQLTFFSKKDPEDTALIQSFDQKVGYKIQHDQTTRQALSNIQQLDLQIFGERLITVPENFKGHLLPYSRVLTQALDGGLKHQGVMTQFNQYLTTVVNNPELRNKAAPTTMTYGALNTYRSETTPLLSLFFKKDSGISKARLKAVLERFADVEPLIEQSQRLAHLLDIKILHGYQEKIQEMVHLLDIIQEQYDKNKIAYLSSALALELSRGVYEVAQYVEFIALLQYDGRVCLQVVKLLVDELASVNEVQKTNRLQKSFQSLADLPQQGVRVLWNQIHQTA